MYFVVFLLFAVFLVIVSHQQHLGEGIFDYLIANLGKRAKGKEGEWFD